MKYFWRNWWMEGEKEVLKEVGCVILVLAVLGAMVWFLRTFLG